VRQLCWSHILRDCVKLSEVRASAAHGRRLVASARELFRLNRAFLAGEVSREAYVEQASALRVVVSEVLSQLGALKTLSKHSAPLVLHSTSEAESRGHSRGHLLHA